jgi:hypothetical protein
MTDSVSGYTFLITQGGRDDLVHCRTKDAWAASRISAFLREIAASNFYAEWLVDTNYADDVVLGVGELASFRALKINAYRIKFVEIANWRLIVAVDHPTRRVAIMAVMPRSDDYEKNSDLWSDIEREYDELGFTRV